MTSEAAILKRPATYAVNYTGSTLLKNMLKWRNPARRADFKAAASFAADRLADFGSLGLTGGGVTAIELC